MGDTRSSRAELEEEEEKEGGGGAEERGPHGVARLGRQQRDSLTQRVSNRIAFAVGR